MYLQSGVTSQSGRFIVDWDDGDGDGDGLTPPLDLVRRRREGEGVLSGLTAVVHVVDVAQLEL